MTEADQLREISDQLRVLTRVCWGLGIGILVLVGVLLWFVRRFRRAMDDHQAENSAKLTAMLAVAESIRVNRKETTIAKEAVAEKVDESTAKVLHKVEQMPHVTADEVVQRMKDGDSGIINGS